MSGRYVGEKVAYLRDIADFATRSGTPIAFLSLEQELAFDRVSWSFLHAGYSYENGFSVLFSSLNPPLVQFCAEFGNMVTSPLFSSLSRAVRQRCSFSPLLYVSVAEVLVANIRANSAISGPSQPGLSSPLSSISQYTDDTSLVLSSHVSITAAFLKPIPFRKRL